LKGKISLIAFPDVYRKTRDLFLGDALLLIRGRLDKSENALIVVAEEIQSIKHSSQYGDNP